ncbi:MAG: cupin domain-containing protein [Chitinophagaceae bacterium]
MHTTNNEAEVMEAKNYRSYQGGYFKVLLDNKETGGSMALLEMVLPKGAEPPPHIHANEDESFYLQEGEIHFFIGGKEIHAKAGDAVFAPRKVLHHFSIQTATARFLNLITPGQLQDYFMEFSTPATNLQVIPPQGPPPQEFITAMVGRLTDTYGIMFI